MTSGLYRGTVTRISGGFVYVRVPKLSGNVEHGPLEPLYSTTVAAGTAVLVGQIEGDPNRLVILRRF